MMQARELKPLPVGEGASTGAPGPVASVLLVALFFVASSFITSAFQRQLPGSRAPELLMPLLMLAFAVIALRQAGYAGLNASAARRPAALAVSGITGALNGLLGVTFVLSVVVGTVPELGAPLEVSEMVRYVVLAPVSEEFLIVGFLFGSLRSRLSLVASIAIAAVMFAVFHQPKDIIGFEIRLLYMISACLLFVRYRSLLLNVFAHVIANALTTFLLPILIVRDTLAAFGDLAFLVPVGVATVLVALLMSMYKRPEVRGQ